MNKKILLLVLMIGVSDSVKAAFSGIDPKMAHILAGAADQVNQATERAEYAEEQLVKHRDDAQAALERAAQLKVDAARLRSDNDALVRDAAEQEAALCAAIERTELQAATIAQLHKEKTVASKQANDFFIKLQALTQEHEAIASAHDKARSALEGVLKGKKQNDDEVLRLQGELASLLSFGVQRSGMPFGVRVQVNPMAALNPFHVDNEQVEKDVANKKLVTDLEAATASQKGMQDAVDEAFALVQEKDKKIKELSARAVHLEKERVALEKENQELENFKGATKAGFDYLDQDDIDEAQEGAATASAQPAMLSRRNETVLEALLIKLRSILDAAKSTITD